MHNATAQTMNMTLLIFRGLSIRLPECEATVLILTQEEEVEDRRRKDLPAGKASPQLRVILCFSLAPDYLWADNVVQALRDKGSRHYEALFRLADDIAGA